MPYLIWALGHLLKGMVGQQWSLGMVSPWVWIWYWVVEWQPWFWPLLFISFYDLGPGWPGFSALLG